MDSRADAEQTHLETIALRYDPSNAAEEFDYHLKRLQANAVKAWLRGERVLEMGCATGELTTLLAPASSRYEVVEGSARNIEVARSRVPDAAYHHSLFEDFQPDGTYSDVLLVCALEHVEDPGAILRRAAAWLWPGGRLHAVVPNAASLHRQVGVAMGILGSTTDLSDSDLRIGHRRVYDVDTFLSELRASGLSVEHWQGIFLKVLSNGQMLDWEWPLIAALDEVARRLPGNAAELYAVCTPA